MSVGAPQGWEDVFWVRRARKCPLRAWRKGISTSPGPLLRRRGSLGATVEAGN